MYVDVTDYGRMVEFGRENLYKNKSEYIEETWVEAVIKPANTSLIVL